MSDTPADLDLAGTLDEAFGLLERGARDRHSPFHTPTVATVGPGGAPALRTVILRDFDRDGPRLRFHTDARSAKVEQLGRDPRVTIHAYDADRKVQVRLDGEAIVHRDDEVARAAWDASQPMSRVCYRIDPAPGTPIADPAAAVIPPGPADPAADPGFGRFAAVVVTISCLEWLHLAAAGHRRARFLWQNGRLDASWLTP